MISRMLARLVLHQIVLSCYQLSLCLSFGFIIDVTFFKIYLYFFDFMLKTIMSEKCKMPKLVVFDLDYTLWPFYIDSDVTPPFRRVSQDVVDHYKKKIKVFPEVPKVLEYLHSQNVEMGIASRTTETKGAHQLTTLLGWDKYFKYKEIYPGCKIEHFRKFKEYTKYDYSDLLFFDDEDRNIVDLKRQNVTSILVHNGVTMAVLKKGLEEFSRR